MPSRPSMRASRFVALAVLICLTGAAFATIQPAAPPAPPILPTQFAGWQIEGAPEASKDAAAADPGTVHDDRDPPVRQRAAAGREGGRVRPLRRRRRPPLRTGGLGGRNAGAAIG